MSNENGKVTAQELDAAIQRAVADSDLELLQSKPPIEQAIRLAKGIEALRDVLTPQVMKYFMPLQGSPLGFKSDKKYPEAVVKDVLIEAFIRGFRPVGNEFNIIAEGFYAAQAGLERKVREYKGVENFSFELQVPQIKDGNALVAAVARYTMHGEPREDVCDLYTVGDKARDLRIPVRVNSGMTVDAVLGKAKRKLYARLLEKWTGVSIPEGEPGDASAINTTAEPAPEPPGSDQQGKRTKPQAAREMGED